MVREVRRGWAAEGLEAVGQAVGPAFLHTHDRQLAHTLCKSRLTHDTSHHRFTQALLNGVDVPGTFNTLCHTLYMACTTRHTSCVPCATVHPYRLS